MRPLFVGWACVALIIVIYLLQSYQPSRVLKYIVSHSSDDPAFQMMRQGAADFCANNGLTLDWVNIPVVETGGLTYMDALASETDGFSSVACQCPPYLENDVASHLSSDVQVVVQVRGLQDPSCVQPVVTATAGFNREGMLKVALRTLPARPAIVSLPWEVSTDLGDGVTVERFSQEHLLARSRSDTIRTLILPDIVDYDYDRLRALFTNVKICVIGHEVSKNRVDACVWQDAYEAGHLSAAMLHNVGNRDTRVGNIDVGIHTKFFRQSA